MGASVTTASFLASATRNRRDSLQSGCLRVRRRAWRSHCPRRHRQDSRYRRFRRCVARGVLRQSGPLVAAAVGIAPAKNGANAQVVDAVRWYARASPRSFLVSALTQGLRRYWRCRPRKQPLCRSLDESVRQHRRFPLDRTDRVSFDDLRPDYLVNRLAGRLARQGLKKKARRHPAHFNRKD